MVSRGRWAVDFEYLDLETNNLLQRGYSLADYEEAMKIIEIMHNKPNFVITNLQVKYPDFGSSLKYRD